MHVELTTEHCEQAPEPAPVVLKPAADDPGAAATAAAAAKVDADKAAAQAFMESLKSPSKK